MSVKLRLRRMGRKKMPYYRIVAIDSRARRDGKYIEKIGHYNPVSDPVEIVIDREKAIKWLDTGAIPSDTVKSFLSKQGILMEWDLKKKGLTDEQIAEQVQKWETVKLENRKKLEAKAAMNKRQQEEEAKAKKQEEEKAAAAEAAKVAEAAAEATEAVESTEAAETTETEEGNTEN